MTGQGEREEEEEDRSENGTSGGVLQNTEVRASSLTKGRPKESLVMGHWRANQQFSVSSKENGGTGESTARVGVRSPADRGTGAGWAEGDVAEQVRTAGAGTRDSGPEQLRHLPLPAWPQRCHVLGLCCWFYSNPALPITAGWPRVTSPSQAKALQTDTGLDACVLGREPGSQELLSKH